MVRRLGEFLPTDSFCSSSGGYAGVGSLTNGSSSTLFFSTAYPVFFDEPNATLWDSEAEPCIQDRFEDYTGVDSLAAFFISLVVFVTVQVIEDKFGPMFKIPWTDGYKKVLSTPDEGGDTDDSLAKGKEGKTEGVDRESSEGNEIEVDA
jgi:hypothetical protein